MEIYSKKLIICISVFVVTICIGVSSCTSDKEDDFCISTQETPTGLIDNTNGTQSLLLDTGEILILEDTTTYVYDVVQNDITGFNSFKNNTISPLAIEWETVVYNGQPEKLTNNNQKVLMSNATSGGLGHGVFICDVTSLFIDVSVPKPDDEVIQGVNDNRCGYNGNTGSNEAIRGTIVNDRFKEDRTIQRVLTYCYYIKYNTLGLPINKWVPCPPSDAKIVYRKGR